jgi:hypothetical protein
MKSKLFIALLIVITVFLLPTVFNPNETINASAQDGNEDEINALLKVYDDALQNELASGNTQEIVDPETGVQKILIGESQEKMDRLWAETLEKIDALQYRSSEEKSETVALITQVTQEPVEFIAHSRTPYNIAAEIEDYESGDYIFQVDVSSGQIIKMWIKDQQNFSVDARYTQNELVKLAQEHVKRLAPKIDLDILELTIQEKSGDVCFFRWEDQSRETPDGTTAFIQVALSRSGDFLNYENTILLSNKKQTSLLDSLVSIPPVIAVGANEYYSNGGSRWGWEKLYDIQRVVLANTSETCCNKEIAWDEIWDYVP